MRNVGNIFKISAIAAAAAFSYPHSVVAGNEATREATSAGSAQQSSYDSFDQLREQTVTAEELLSADVFNVGNPIGNVRDLVLNEAGTAVEYVLYEIPYPYSIQGADNGFVAYDNLAVELAPGTFGSHVRFDDQASAAAPDTLTLDRAEADNRLMSRILDSEISFAGDETRPVEDVLIDRESGEIAGYVVNGNPDAWFNDEPRIVPPDQIEISAEGDVTSPADFAALESVDAIE